MIEVVAAGPLMTVQDLGRPLARRYGVAPGGAMDSLALAVANRLVGNAPDATGLEITAGGAALRFAQPALIALCGADLGATLDGKAVPLWSAVRVAAGALLQWRGRAASWGARVYLAAAGGIAVPMVLGSRSTNLAGSFGGFQGRPLRPGDQLELGERPDGSLLLTGQRWPEALRPAYCAEPVVRIVPGPHHQLVGPDVLDLLAAQPFRISATSNRMGYRLEGPRLAVPPALSIASLGVVTGTIQLPPSGEPILLMADAQTTGGYPVVGVVISADLPLAAQLLPGDTLRFGVATVEEALAARRFVAAQLSQAPEPNEGDLLASLAGAPGDLSGWQ